MVAAAGEWEESAWLIGTHVGAALAALPYNLIIAGRKPLHQCLHFLCSHTSPTWPVTHRSLPQVAELEAALQAAQAALEAKKATWEPELKVGLSGLDVFFKTTALKPWQLASTRLRQRAVLYFPGACEAKWEVE